MLAVPTNTSEASALTVRLDIAESNCLEPHASDPSEASSANNKPLAIPTYSRPAPESSANKNQVAACFHCHSRDPVSMLIARTPSL